eukprot:NODE_154_length_16838_cov_0.293327.p2 type:complete len:537 gc:universal NODE_154_length_16838_cov_0.293327:7789-9399(+)
MSTENESSVGNTMELSVDSLPRHDSKFEIYDLLDKTNKKPDFKFEFSYFPNTLPSLFMNSDFNNSCKPTSTGKFDAQPILWLKNESKPMNMKILHPQGYHELKEKLTNIYCNIQDRSYTDWDNCNNIYYLANSLETIDLLRKELESRGQFVMRFDIRLFYEQFYTHILSWIDEGARKEGKKAWMAKKARKKTSINEWLSLLEDAICNLQYRETIGLPIGSDLLKELAESYLICLDAILIKDKPVENVKIIRCHDNYDVVCQSPSDCEKMVYHMVYKLREFNFTVNFESNVPSSDPPVQLSTMLNGNLSHALRVLDDFRTKMDYHLVLSHFAEKLKGFPPKRKSNDYYYGLISNHPGIVHHLVNLFPTNKTLLTLLVKLIKPFLRQGIATQFICVLEMVRLNFNSTDVDKIESTLTEMGVDIGSCILVQAYMSLFETMRSTQMPSKSIQIDVLQCKSNEYKLENLVFTVPENVSTDDIKTKYLEASGCCEDLFSVYTGELNIATGSRGIIKVKGSEQLLAQHIKSFFGTEAFNVVIK